MAKVKKAQAGKVIYPSSRPYGPFGEDKIPVIKSVDTTGYAAGRKKFPATITDRTTTVGDKVFPRGASTTPRSGTVGRKEVRAGIKRMSNTPPPKKRGGKISKTSKKK